jgi:uncharacterized protein (TIGR03067 family)
MKSRFLPAAVLLALFSLVFLGTARADDLKGMEGTWIVETAEAAGKPVDSEDLKDLVVTIAGDRYTVKTRDEIKRGTLKLDETQKPKTMDATNTEGLDVGKVVKAIYELNGDTMRVCYALDGGARPTELASKEGSTALVITYKREK